MWVDAHRWWRRGVPPEGGHARPAPVGGRTTAEGCRLTAGRRGGRSHWPVTACLLAALVLLPGQAVAERTLLSDGFDGADGSAPDIGRWSLEGVDPADTASVQGGALELNGSAAVRSREALALHSFVVRVDVAVLNASGDSAIVEVLSVHRGTTDGRLWVHHSGGQGWYLKSVRGGVTTVHNDPRPAVIGEWYSVAVRVEGDSLNITVSARDDGSYSWSHEADIDPLEHQLRVQLAVNGSRARFDNVLLTTDQWQESPVLSVSVGLFVILFVVLLGPFLVKKIERQLEAFLFVMGVVAVSLDTVLLRLSPSGGGEGLDPVWSVKLVEAGLLDPLKITAAVLVAGLLFHYLRDRFKAGVEKAIARLSLSAVVFLMVVVLGLVSSLITAIIAALLLVEFISVLRLDKRTETALTVIACFSIGLGAALTPVGEPLSTIVIDTKLGEKFWYLLELIGIYIIPTVVALGAVAVLFLRRGHVNRETLDEMNMEKEGGLKEVGVRGLKVYIFVMALVFLGTGFAPIIEWYIKRLGWAVLYWVNTSSAILDNATLASAEIVPSMTEFQIIAALMGLLIAGGMLIPGNIPNIISAGKLDISSKEWARYGVPVGAVMMLVFFIILLAQSML
jgi:predicted cation transporter